MFTTLRAKLFAGYLAILVLVAALGGYAIFSFRSLSEITTSGLDLNAESTLANVRMYESLVRINEGALKMLGAEALQGKKALNEQPSVFYSELKNAQRTVASAMPSVRARISELLTKVEVSWQQYEALLPEFMRRVDINPLDARTLYERAMIPVYNQLKTLTFSLFEENVLAFQAARQKTSDESRSASVAIITVTLLALALGFIASIVIARRTTKPLQDLTQNLKELQAGNLRARLPIVSADEIGNVSFEFNRLTERLQQYEEMNINQILREKQKSESVIASFDDPLFLFDEAHKVVLMNRAAERIIGKNEAEVLGIEIGTLFHDDELIQIILHVIGSLTSPNEAPPIIALAGKEKTRYYRLAAVKIESGGVLLAFTDITHFKELDKMKSDFIAKVSHEFRTPLTSMKMSLDLLDREALGSLNTDQHDLVLTSQKDIDRLDKLIRDLLSVSRLESGAGRESNLSTNARECFTDLTRSVQRLFDEKGVRLRCEQENVGNVAIAKSDLEAVLQNLLSNALKCTPSGGIVNASISMKEPLLVIEVRDSGIGIAEADKARIFEKFVQVKPTDSATPGSVGLGLAIVTEIVRKYGGTVGLESEVGKGSLFTVKLVAHDPNTVR